MIMLFSKIPILSKYDLKEEPPFVYTPNWNVMYLLTATRELEHAIHIQLHLLSAPREGARKTEKVLYQFRRQYNALVLTKSLHNCI